MQILRGVHPWRYTSSYFLVLVRGVAQALHVLNKALVFLVLIYRGTQAQTSWYSSVALHMFGCRYFLVLIHAVIQAQTSWWSSLAMQIFLGAHPWRYTSSDALVLTRGVTHALHVPNGVPKTPVLGAFRILSKLIYGCRYFLMLIHGVTQAHTSWCSSVALHKLSMF